MKKLKNHIDTNLVIAYQNGNKEVATQLVKRWHVQFCKLAYWICKDADIAKDIAQESWIVIFQKIEELREPTKFKSWAISIVNRKTIDFLRATKREQNKQSKLYDQTPKEVGVEESEDEKEAVLSALKKEIDQLKEDQKAIIKLFYGENYSLKQISELLEISVGTAKSRLFHAREKLKTSLKGKIG
jgi:RNA polymerase sigma factor (sigma-70 family)